MSANGRPLDRIDVLYEALDSASPGDRLELRVVRGTEERDITVDLRGESQEVAT